MLNERSGEILKNRELTALLETGGEWMWFAAHNVKHPLAQHISQGISQAETHKHRDTMEEVSKEDQFLILGDRFYN